MLYKKIVLGLLHYDYSECDQVLDAVEDFYKGPDWLINQDPEELHTQVSSKAVRLQDVRELDFDLDLGQYLASLHFQDHGLKRFMRRITFNGHFLPANKDSIVTNDIVQGRKRIGNMHRARKVLQYDITSNRGAVFKRNLTQAFFILMRSCLISIKLLFTLGSKNDEYRKKLPYMQTKHFWEDFLLLNKKLSA